MLQTTPARAPGDFTADARLLTLTAYAALVGAAGAASRSSSR